MENISEDSILCFFLFGPPDIGLYSHPHNSFQVGEGCNSGDSSTLLLQTNLLLFFHMHYMIVIELPFTSCTVSHFSSTELAFSSFLTHATFRPLVLKVLDHDPPKEPKTGHVSLREVSQECVPKQCCSNYSTTGTQRLVFLLGCRGA